MFKFNNHKGSLTYVVAGFETLFSFLERDLKDITDRQKVTSKLVKAALISFGTNATSNLNTRKFDSQKYADSIGKITNKCKWYVDSGQKLFIDSGGYQIISGYVPKLLIPKFRESYIKFLNKYKDTYTNAFSMDAPIIPDFSDRNELLNINVENFKLIDKLEEEVKNRLYFVTHSASVNDVHLWMKLIHEYNLLEKYSNYSVGGLVSSRPSTKQLYYNVMNLGFLEILSGLKTIPDILRLHILGSSTSRNIIYFSMLVYFLEDVLNTDVEVTFDSSAVFTKVIRSRSFTYLDKTDYSSYNLSLKSADLDEINKRTQKHNRTLIAQQLNDIIDYCGLTDKYSINGNIYDDDNKTFAEENRLWIMLNEIYINQLLIDYYEKRGLELYKLYKDGNITAFLNEITNEYKKHGHSILQSQIDSIITSFDIFVDFINKNKDPQLVYKYLETMELALDSREDNPSEQQLPILGV